MTSQDRKEKGREIANLYKLSKEKGSWLVPSSKGNRHYRIVVENNFISCTCPDFETYGDKCKHIFAVEYTIAHPRPVGRPPKQEIEYNPEVRPTYPQDWKKYNAAQTQEKDLVSKLLQGLCDGVIQPKQKMGRPKAPLTDIIFGAVMKVYGTHSGRRTDSEIRSCASKGLISSCPHYNTLFKYLEDPLITPIIRKMIEDSSLPLQGIERDFGPDSTGVASDVYLRWFDEKFGKPANQLVWSKVHMMVGLKTKIVAAVEITDAGTHDNTQFESLFNSTVKNFRIRDLCADKAYLSKDNLEMVSSHGAVPYIPFKSNTTGEGPELWRKMYHMFQYNRQEFLDHYHKRSNAESAMWMIKSKFGERVRSRTPVSQKNEVLCKVLCHNLTVLVHCMYKFDIDPPFLKIAA